MGDLVSGPRVRFLVIAALAIWICSCAHRRRLTVSEEAGRSGPPTPLEELARSFGDTRSDAQIRQDHAFLRAVSDGDVKKAERLLARGARVSARLIDEGGWLGGNLSGYTALHYAAIDGHVRMVRMLLRHHPELDAERKGKTPLYHAVVLRHTEIVRALKAAGARGDPARILSTRRLACAACKGFEMEPGEGFPPYPGFISGDGPSIEAVLATGADVNAAGPEGFTALMFAANLGLIQNVNALLAAGADPRIQASDGSTALSLTERQSSVNVREREQAADILRRALAAH
jgi:hypothetical protein